MLSNRIFYWRKTKSFDLIPAITFVNPFISPTTAPYPILLAKTLSAQLGAPPLWMCPRIETLIS